MNLYLMFLNIHITIIFHSNSICLFHPKTEITTEIHTYDPNLKALTFCTPYFTLFSLKLSVAFFLQFHKCKQHAINKGNISGLKLLQI